MNFEFEFTARDTPQQNSLTEVAFVTLANCGWAMMHHANLPMMDNYRLAHEAFQCATQLDRLTVVEVEGITKTCYEHFIGQNPMFMKHLRMWGEAGTVKIKTSMSPKLNDKGTHCMFVGYMYNHLGDCYRMYDPKTGRTHETCDIIWLKWMLYKRLPNQRELTTEPIMYDIIQDQQHDQDQDEENNQAVGTQNDDAMQKVDDPASNEDGEGHNSTNDQTDQSNNDEQESTQDDTEETPPQLNKITTTSSGRAVK